MENQKLFEKYRSIVGLPVEKQINKLKKQFSLIDSEKETKIKKDSDLLIKKENEIKKHSKSNPEIKLKISGLDHKSDDKENIQPFKDYSLKLIKKLSKDNKSVLNKLNNEFSSVPNSEDEFLSKQNKNIPHVNEYAKKTDITDTNRVLNVSGSSYNDKKDFSEDNEVNYSLI